MRGEFGEFNPWQVPMGAITEDVLKLAGFLTYRIDDADAVDDIVGAGCDMAFDGNLQVAILLSQTFDRPQAMDAMMLDRRELVRQLLIDRRAISSSSAGSARRPTTSPRPAIIRSTFICGAPWAAPQ